MNRSVEMDDQPTLAILDGGLKRQLEGEQSAIPTSAQSNTDPVATTNGTQMEGNGSHEPTSKRLKLDQTEQGLRMDAREKVKGIALIKPE